MEFYTRGNRPQTIATDPGREEADVYNVVLDRNGHKQLKLVGTTNVYDMIQAGREETLLENIVRRAEAGDIDALSVQQGIYADITAFPTSLAEAQQLIHDAHQQFYSLPMDVRAKYGQDPSAYIADVGSEHWLDLMGLKAEQNTNNEENEA